MSSSVGLRRIAVIGAGNAGLDLALRCVRSGFLVTLEDVMPSRLRRAEESIAPTAAHGILRLATTVEEAVRDADLAIDFVPDELESKLEIFSMLDRMAPPRTILCTPTTALSIADLASCTFRPQLCFALRLPSRDPAKPHSKPAELVTTSRSDPDATFAIESWLLDLGYNVTTFPDAAELSPAH